MKKTIARILIVVITLVTMASSVHAEPRGGSAGQTLFGDALMGAALGGIVGAAAYAIDDDELGKKIGTGVIVGAVLGLAYGLYETRSFVEYRDGKAYVGIPVPEVEVTSQGTVYRTSLFHARF